MCWPDAFDLCHGNSRPRSSARYHGTLKPYCIFTGDEQSDIYAWLADHDVKLISHTPAWTEQLLALAKAKAKVGRGLAWDCKMWTGR